MLVIFCLAIIFFIFALFLNCSYEFFDDILEKIIPYELYRKIYFCSLLLGTICITTWIVLAIRFVIVMEGNV